MKKNTLSAICAILVLVIAQSISGCKKSDYSPSTTTDLNMVDYLRSKPDSFSLFTEILVKTENAAFLNAYGSYTCFAPSNTGVRSWLAVNNYASVAAADINVLKDIVRFHLLNDTLTTASFKDGKLPVPTMYGQFLITGVAFENGNSSYTVNRQANVTKSNVKVGNGIVHEIDRVLTPAKNTIATQLEADPKYSIFVQALKETGYFALLNTVDPDTSKRWKTVIAESNQVLADSGYTSYAVLKSKLSKTGNPTNVLDSLHIYVAYHILDGILFLGDIITQSSHATLQPQEVISTQLKNQQVLVNEDMFDGILEKGVILLRTISDNSASNGVWHNSTGHFKPKVRKPAAVYWDVCAFPEVMNLPAYYKKQNFTFSRAAETDRPIKSINWEYKSASNFVTYFYSSTSSLSKDAVNADVLVMPLGPPSRATWFEFTTPVIIKGRYKVWICYNARNANMIYNVKVDGELLQRPVNFAEFNPAGTDAELETLGWKRYIAATNNGYCCSRLVGAVDIKTTDKHVVRLENIGSGTNAANYLDMIHFIPADQLNQYLPRFKPDGTQVFL